MVFNIDNYKGRFAMHCATVREAKEFCDYLYSIGRRWQTGYSYSDFIGWSTHECNTCYLFNEGIVVSVYRARLNGYDILEWSDFSNQFTKNDLRDGMIVEYVNGDLRVVLGNRLVGQDGHNTLDLYDDDLTILTAHGCNIVRVYKGNPRFISELFNKEYLTLIWERKEKPKPIEMTLEEICKELGREIKIVKDKKGV